MDVRRLELLRELRLRGTLAAVARATHRTPSAVSQQLKVLEREVGAPLTERSGRGLALTAAGTALAAAADDVALATARAQQVWRTWVESPQGVVDLAVFPTAGRMFLPGLLARVRATPGLEVVAVDVDPAEGDFRALVADHDLVVAHAIQPDPGWREPGVIAVPLVDEPLDVALPRDHPLAARDEVTAEEVAAEPWIGALPRYPVETVLREIERTAGRPIEVVQRFTDLGVTAALVAAGEGVALLPRFTASRDPGVVLRPLAGIRPVRRIAALLRSEAAERPSVRTVLEDLRATAAAIRPDAV